MASKIQFKNKPNNRAVFLDKIRSKRLFTIEEAKTYAISQATLSRMVQEKLIKRVARGQYLHAEYDNNLENIDFAIACKNFGSMSVIGGLSALAYYDLVDEVPNRIWVLVPPDIKTNDSLYRCIRTNVNLKQGVVKKEDYKITNIERTIIEAFKFSSKIGLSTVVKATRRALIYRLTSEKELMKLAKKLKLESYILKYWEAIIPEANPF